MVKTRSNLLVVPPFECAWLIDDNLRFPEPGRGCVAFEACADNDVTVVLKEKAGSKHYRTDMDPNYAIVLGSHRNRRLKIEVDGVDVFDAPGVVVSPSHFQKFWISIFDGHITVGKGEPGEFIGKSHGCVSHGIGNGNVNGKVMGNDNEILIDWTHSDPSRQIQYIGLSSWDKHVGYRNIRVLPYSKSLPQSSKFPNPSLVSEGLASFLENPNLADLHFCVGPEKKIVPAHRLLLSCCGCSKFSTTTYSKDVVMLPSVDYPVLHAFLQYAYTGQTQLQHSRLPALRQLSEDFGLQALAVQCHEVEAQMGNDSKPEDFVQVTHKSARSSDDFNISFLGNSPVDCMKLQDLLDDEESADVEIFVDGNELVARAHKLVLSSWSVPLRKMFTNGMQESSKTKVNIRDARPDVLLVMLRFLYSGNLHFNDNNDADPLSLIILADKFDIPLLQHECSMQLIENITEESVCSILQVASYLPCCELVQDACVEFFAKHFEQCLANAADFKDLDIHSFKKILQRSDLCVDTEERVLNASIWWASAVDHVHDWRHADNFLREHSLDELFAERFNALNELLPDIHFALMPLAMLLELKSSKLSATIMILKDVVNEALDYLAPNKESSSNEKAFCILHSINNQDRLIQLSYRSIQFSHRSSNLKELQYICDGDSNGVIYFAGTSYGAHAWMNPVLIKNISVVASSPPSRFTDAKALVSRQYQGTSFAGPCFYGGHPTSWWKIDLGEESQLMCNHYTLRQDGSMNYIRSWCLQGSNDDKNWVDLRVHHDDRTLSNGGQFASWSIHGANSYVPFRFFRVMLTGPTTSSSQPWNLCICYIELYGYFSSSKLM